MGVPTTVSTPPLQLGPEMLIEDAPAARRSGMRLRDREEPGVIPCKACNGTGWRRHRHGGRYHRWHGVEGRERCSLCHGRGLVAGRHTVGGLR